MKMFLKMLNQKEMIKKLVKFIGAEHIVNAEKESSRSKCGQWHRIIILN